MIMVESLHGYLASKRKTEFMSLAEQIYQFVDFAATDYPDRKDWYFNKQLEGMAGPEREIFFVRNPEAFRQIVGFTCLKKTAQERKICTLYVSEQHREKGVAQALVDRSLQWLGTTEPLFTIAEDKLSQFLPIIQKYGWHLKARAQGAYGRNNCELCFNGALIKERAYERPAEPMSTDTRKLTTFVGALHQKAAETGLTK